jgi:Ricin-type beta-trefoil lectin domain-like
MRRMHRTIGSLAGLMLTAGATLASIPPAGAATSAPMDFPASPSKGTLVNAQSGKCLAPSANGNPSASGDVIVQRTCDGSTVQEWLLQPLGTKTFIPGWSFVVQHTGYHIVNAQTGLCLDDQNGISSDGATVQEWTCNTTSTTMQWGSWGLVDGNYIVNLRATNNNDTLTGMGVSGGSFADEALVQLFAIPANIPPQQEWQFDQS